MKKRIIEEILEIVSFLLLGLMTVVLLCQEDERAKNIGVAGLVTWVGSFSVDLATNKRYAFPWLVIFILSLCVFCLLLVFFDEEKLMQMWWLIPVGDMIAGIFVNTCQLFFELKTQKTMGILNDKINNNEIKRI